MRDSIKLLALFLLVVTQRKEFLAGLRIVPEDAQHRRGDGFTVDLLHASHHHAHVPVMEH